MKQYMNRIIMIALVLMGWTGAWAGDVTVIVGPNANAGTVVASKAAAGQTCTLTVTPASGYYLTKDNLTAVTVVSGDALQGPRRGIDIKSEPVEITASDATADPSGVTTYTFTMPADGNIGVEVTADFQTLIAIEPTVTLQGWTYGDEPNQPEVGNNPGNGEVTFTYAEKESTTFTANVPSNVGDYTVKATVAAAMQYAAGEATADFSISAKALTEDMVTLSPAEFVYNAETQKPEVTVKDGDKVLTEGTDYELTNEGGAKVGSHDVIVTGKGNYTGTITKQFSITALKYGLTVNDVEVTNVNANDVFGDGGSDVRVKFDGKNQLVLNNAIFPDIYSSLDSLAIYLIGDRNSIENIYSNGENHKLTFTTDGNHPGKLTLNYPTDLDHFDVNYEQNLGLYGNEVRVGVDPLVNESGAAKTVDMGNATLPDDQVVTTVIDNVIVTADKSNGDGVNNNTIELGSGMTLNEVAEVIKSALPGTAKYAEGFSGLTFMIPAGTGEIIIELKTGEDGAVAVQIGEEEPIIYKSLLEFKAKLIQFAVQVATYVRIYNCLPSGKLAPGKAGKKTSTSVGIRTVGVRTNKVQASNSPANSNNVPKDEQKSTDEVNDLVKTTDTDGNVKLNDEDAITVVTLPEDMLKEEPYSPSVDFRNTSVTGVFVSRTTGVFNGVSKNTFIFMPVGNNTDEANVIIGSVCQFAQLDGNMKDDEQFAPIDEFVAQRTELTTSFEQGQLATVYLPFAITATDAAGWGTFYKFNGVERGYVKIKEETGDLEPNVPYLFKPAEEATKIATGVASIVLPKSNAAQRRTDGDQLVGSYSTQTAASGMYMLRSEGTDFKFEQMQAGEKIKPFQAYLKLNDTSTTVLKVTDNEEVPTGIVSVKEQTTAAKWQTLSGITLDKKPQEKGVYIRNGRKIVVR